MNDAFLTTSNDHAQPPYPEHAHGRSVLEGFVAVAPLSGRVSASAGSPTPGAAQRGDSLESKVTSVQLSG